MITLIHIIVLELLSVMFINLEDQPAFEEVEPRFANPCTTPNNDVGICVEMRTCSVFIDAIRSGKNDSYDFIRESQCGSPNEDSKRPKVCCGKYDNYLNKISPKNDPFSKNCGIQSQIKSNQIIVDGVGANLGQFPWMARLRHRRRDGLFTYGCVGFLISEKKVLTAAHCIRSKSLASLGPIYQAQLGEYDTESDPDCIRNGKIVLDCADTPQLLRVAEPIVHAEYAGDIQQHNDIAIIPLKDPAKFTDYVFPICLPAKLSQITPMWISGWGKTETKNASPIKLTVHLPRVTKEQCANLYKPIGITILDSQLCAGGESGRDSRSGDSGGPLMVRRNGVWYAEGIVSFGKGCGEEGWPGIYTSIPYYMSWIKMVVKQNLEQQEQEKDDSHNIVEEDYFIWSS